MTPHKHQPTIPATIADKIQFFTLRKVRLQEALLLGPFAIGLSVTQIEDEIAKIDAFLLSQTNFEESENTTFGFARTRDIDLVELCRVNGVNNAKTKTAVTYNEVIAETYLVIGPMISINPKTSKPTLEVDKTPEGYNFHVNRRGYFGGFVLLRRLQGETSFAQIANTSKSDILYKEPMIAGTSFASYFTISEEKVGLQSNIVEVVI